MGGTGFAASKGPDCGGTFCRGCDFCTPGPCLQCRYSDNALLDTLDRERSKFSTADEQAMHAMIDELVRRGVYPTETVEGNPNDVYTMVEGWGARWHEWRKPHECPHCKADLRNHVTGPPFKREIGLYDTGADETTMSICPDCSVNLRAGPTAWERVVTGKTPAGDT